MRENIFSLGVRCNLCMLLYIYCDVYFHGIQSSKKQQLLILLDSFK
jgi:hypothetical protein